MEILLENDFNIKNSVFYFSQQSIFMVIITYDCYQIYSHDYLLNK